MVCGAQVLKSLITQKANKPFKTTIKSMVREHPAPLCFAQVISAAHSCASPQGTMSWQPFHSFDS